MLPDMLNSARRHLTSELMSGICTYIQIQQPSRDCCQERYGAFLVVLAEMGVRINRSANGGTSIQEIASGIRALDEDSGKHPRIKRMSKARASLLRPRSNFSCAYCTRDILKELRGLFDGYVVDVPGLDFEIFMHEGSGCLTTERPDDKP